jgi:hypothetical protein
MSNPRVTSDELVTLKAMYANNPERIGYLAYTLALDLEEARARILELERYSASQEEALGMMERGSL